MTKELKTDPTLTKKIPVMEMFGPTIQGEGLLIGAQTHFIRFGLCDYKCTMCDSMHAVDPKQVQANAEWLTQQEIIDKFANHHAKSKGRSNWITYSGGNPCIHNLNRLTADFKSAGFHINVETQATKWQQYLNYVDVITMSPKGPGMGESFDSREFRAFLDQVRNTGATKVCKIVVFDQRDLEFAAHVFEICAEYGVVGKYLSLGNSYPPGREIADSFGNSDRQEDVDNLLRLELLKDYRVLCDNILSDERFFDTIFLPQLHVLTWANKAEV